MAVTPAPPVAHTSLRAGLGRQFADACTEFGITAPVARDAFHELTAPFEQDPGSFRRARFSAVNADGIPFQWSVSAGREPGGLRFLVDCGYPATSIGERVVESLRRLECLLWQAGADRRHIDQVMQLIVGLSPPAACLDRTRMGCWLGVSLHRAAGPSFKVYVNQRGVPPLGAYKRVIRSAVTLGRLNVLSSLESLVRAVGQEIAPVALALEVEARSLGRLKMYFRATQPGAEFVTRFAECAGCEIDGSALRLFGRGLLRGQPWPARAAVLSVEYGSDRHTPSLKLDINVATALACDRETDTNIRRVLADLSLDHHEYDAMLRVCRCTLADGQRQILFAGLALRPGDTRVNIYAHPLPPPVE